MKTSICKISDYSARYRQILLPITPGISQTDEYRRVVLQGQPATDYAICFNREEIIRYRCETPAGEAEIILAEDREDFVHLYRALAYKCEPVPIPVSVGAVTISGLINWVKIQNHKEQYLSQGGTDWKKEFRRFTAEKSNYCDSIILLSCGPYSSVPAEQVKLSENEWEERSRTIRMYHELTHFVCRKLFPEKKDIIRDEVYADCIGLIAAFGTYDSWMAKLFLGIESDIYRKGGRLEHYAPECKEEDINRAKRWIEKAEAITDKVWKQNQWGKLPKEGIDETIFELITVIYQED